jgi:hypothetical protein
LACERAARTIFLARRILHAKINSAPRTEQQQHIHTHLPLSFIMSLHLPPCARFIYFIRTIEIYRPACLIYVSPLLPPPPLAKQFILTAEQRVSSRVFFLSCDGVK